MSNPYIKILDILNKYEPSDGTIFFALLQLDNYTTNSIHDKIFDYLCDFIETRNIFLLDVVKEMCRQEVFRIILHTQQINDE